MMNRSRIRELLKAYEDNKINRKDFDELQGYLRDGLIDGEIDAYFKELLEEISDDEDMPIDSAKIYNRIIGNPKFREEGELKPVSVARGLSTRFWRISVAAMLCLGAGLYLFEVPFSRNSDKQAKREAAHLIKLQENTDINGPTLLLADGTKINLEDVEDGLLSTQGDADIVISGDTLAYKPAVMKGLGGASPMNSIMTPKGKQYHMILPDGTSVWLNAATTLTYPVRFDGEKRVVEIDGEAYFDVVTDPKQPFVVKSNLQELEVIGTSFNLSSYDDDAYVTTTLIEGEVRVKRFPSADNQSSTILKPGQQSTVVQGKSAIHVQAVDVSESASWRKGVFVFNNEAVKEVMKKVSRWYNVDVEYRNGVEGELIGGSIQRFEDINELMKSLQATGVLHYKMEGGKIIIMK